MGHLSGNFWRRGENGLQAGIFCELVMFKKLVFENTGFEIRVITNLAKNLVSFGFFFPEALFNLFFCFQTNL